MESLDRDRYECHVLTTYDTFRHYETTLNQLGVPLHSLHHGDLHVINRGQAIARYIRLMRILRPQIVHGWLHYPNLIARAARLACPPHRLITAIRSNYSRTQQRSERLTAQFSDFRIVNRKPLVNEIIGRPTPITINNGLSLKNFAQADQTATKNDETFKILVPARIEPRKGHIIFIESLHKAQFQSNPQITLIGDVTNTKTQEEIDTSIARCKLNYRINQLPATNNIVPFYHNTDITVLPSISESFPNVILESFAAAKPIIVSAAANKTNIVGHGINGWVFPTGDSDALAQCLNTASRTTFEDRKLMGEHGRAIAEQYTIEKMVELYTQLYERALKDS